jgi:uncharacterized protein YkwD
MRFARPPIHLLAALVVCGLLFAAPARAGGACPSASAQPSDAERRELARATLCLVNEQRERRGLASLRLNAKLSRAAQGHSEDMARKDYFDHTSPSGDTFADRIRRAGYLAGARSWTIAENIAWGGGSLASPGSTVKAWMRSPGHRANILQPRFRELGIGIADDAPVRGADGATYTTNFGFRG